VMSGSGVDRVAWLRDMIQVFKKELNSLTPQQHVKQCNRSGPGGSCECFWDIPTEAEVLAITTSDFSRGFADGYAKGWLEGKAEGYARAEGRTEGKNWKPSPMRPLVGVKPRGRR
jgi:hypothetical protein